MPASHLFFLSKKLWNTLYHFTHGASLVKIRFHYVTSGHVSHCIKPCLWFIFILYYMCFVWLLLVLCCALLLLGHAPLFWFCSCFSLSFYSFVPQMCAPVLFSTHNYFFYTSSFCFSLPTLIKPCFACVLFHRFSVFLVFIDNRLFMFNVSCLSFASCWGQWLWLWNCFY